MRLGFWNPPHFPEKAIMLDLTIEMTLPYATDDLPGIGGRLRAKPEHFVVEEIPLYEPQESGNISTLTSAYRPDHQEVEAACARLFD